MNKLKTSLLIVSILINLTGCKFTPIFSYEKTTYYNTEVTINDTLLTLSIADTEKKRQKGLMNRLHLDENDGMIFIFPKQQIQSFWMKNTYIPLDLIFLDQNFTVVDLKSNFRPCQEIDLSQDECPTYQSQTPAQYVIELNQGSIEKLDLQINDVIPLEI